MKALIIYAIVLLDAYALVAITLCFIRSLLYMCTTDSESLRGKTFDELLDIISQLAVVVAINVFALLYPSIKLYFNL